MKKRCLSFLFVLSLACSASGETGGTIRPLAQDGTVVARSPDPIHNPLHNPMLVALPGGRLVGGYIVADHGAQAPEVGVNICTSDDGGLTWEHRARFTIMGLSRLVVANGVVYLIGSANTMHIAKSMDNGTTWSRPRAVAPGPWHQSATNFIHAKGNIYLATEKRIGDEITGWKPGILSPVLMRAKETDDLTRPESWTFSQDYSFADIIPGYRENNPEIDYFGVPFFPQNFPDAHVVSLNPRRPFWPMGWLESNVAQITDPDHYWYDPEGKTFHILMRAHTGGTGYAALAKVVENDDGTMTTSLETAPSGKKMLFLPMPGGQMRFHICYDEQSQLYWLLGTQATDSMTRGEHLPEDRYNLPNNERQRMVLHFSKNLVDWCFAGVVAMGSTPNEARHYGAMDIDGEDLVILSRSGDEDAKNPHDGNIITFHRVKNFRDLVY